MAGSLLLSYTAAENVSYMDKLAAKASFFCEPLGRIVVALVEWDAKVESTGAEELTGRLNTPCPVLLTLTLPGLEDLGGMCASSNVNAGRWSPFTPLFSRWCCKPSMWSGSGSGILANGPGSLMDPWLYELERYLTSGTGAASVAVNEERLGEKRRVMCRKALPVEGFCI